MEQMDCTKKEGDLFSVAIGRTSLAELGEKSGETRSARR